MTTTSATQAAGGGLEGTAWNAVEVSGTTVTVDATVADRRPHLVFATEGRVSGSDGCNRLTGRYTVTGANGVSFGEMASTRMACPGSDELAQQFLAALKGTSHWNVVKDRLEISGATGKALAVFERRP